MTAPPGAYAGGKRSPAVWVLLCPECAGYAPVTPKGYSGFLSGICQGCGSAVREMHRFPAYVASAEGCSCRGWHERVTGDLHAEAAGRRQPGTCTGPAEVTR